MGLLIRKSTGSFPILTVIPIFPAARWPIRQVWISATSRSARTGNCCLLARSVRVGGNLLTWPTAGSRRALTGLLRNETSATAY